MKILTLFGFLLLFSGLGATAQPQCDQLWAEVTRLAERSPIPPAKLLEKARATRACYETLPRERSLRLSNYESYALTELGFYQEATSLLDKTFGAFHAQTAQDSIYFSRMYNRRGSLNYYLDQSFASLRDYLLAYTYVSAESDMNRHIGVLNNMGLGLENINMDTFANEVYRAAWHLTEEHGGTLTQIAFLESQQAQRLEQEHPQRTDEIRALYNSAIARFKQAPPSYRLPEAMIGFALFLNRQQAHQEALPHLTRAIELASLTEGYADNATHISALIARAQVHQQMGRAYYALAEEDLFLALNMTNLFGEPAARRWNLTQLGAIYELQDEQDRAEQAYQQAINVVEDTRAQLRGTAWTMSAFDDARAPYRGLVRVLLQKGENEAAFMVLDQMRGRYLREMQAQNQMLLNIPPTTRRTLDSLNYALENVRYDLLALSAEAPTFLNQKIQEALLLIARKQLLDQVPQPDDVSRETLTFALPDLQAHLADQNQTLLSYFIEDDPVLGNTAHVFVLTPDSLYTQPLHTTHAEIQALISEVSPLLVSAEHPAGFNESQFTTAPLAELYQQVFAPVAHLIPAETSLVVLPDDALVTMPFGMLLEEDPGPLQYDDAPFLIYRYPISTELSAALMLVPPPERYPDLDVLALGRSDFSQTHPQAQPINTRTNQGKLANLPYVENELNVLDRLFSRKRVGLNAAASKTILTHGGYQPRILHLASHAFISPATPLYNAILLFPATHPERANDSSSLYFYELERQTFAAELVMLSGCNTANGPLRQGEGLLGLQYAFRVAGAAGSVANLWYVDDASAVALTKVFYENLQKGHPRDRALQLAQVHYLKNTQGPRASPFFWAAPMLSGQIRPIALQPSTGLAWGIWVGLGLLLLGLSLLLSRRYRPVS